jgi:hypothetical protein
MLTILLRREARRVRRMRANARVSANVILKITDPDGRVRRFAGHNVVTDYGLFLLMQFMLGSVLAQPAQGASANVSLGPATRWNDGTYVYPSLYDMGANTALSGTQTFASTSGVVTASGFGGGFTHGLFGYGTGTILVATSDSSAPSETQFQWPSNTTCIWASSQSTVSTSASNDSWTTSGSTSGATPPQAKYVFTDTATAASAVTIQSMGFTLAFTPGTVSPATNPTAQAAPTPQWVSATPTNIQTWPIISKVIPSGAPISVAAGSTMAATYIFTVST